MLVPAGNCLANILLLPGFCSATEQNYKAIAISTYVHSAGGAEVDPALEGAAAHALGVR